MIKIYQQVSGDAVSEHAMSMDSAELLSSDMFLVSTPVLGDRPVPAGCQNIPGNILKSARSFYGSLSSQIYDQCINEFGLKPMAYEDEEHYSLDGHVHNYSKFEIKPLCVQTDSDVQLSALADFIVDSRKNTVSMPPITTYKVPDPYIGQLRFLAVTNLPPRPNTEQFYSSPSFDGWVYADGRQLKKNDFPIAYEYFGDAYGSSGLDDFCIPDFRRFISMESDFKTDVQMTNHITETNILLRHTHNVSAPAINGTAELKVKFRACKNIGHGPGCHGSHGTAYDASQIYDVFVKVDNIECLDSHIKPTDDTRSTYPNHTLLPVLIYIGKYGA